MNIQYINIGLSEKDEREIKRLLEVETQNPDDLEQMWYLLDLVWDEIGCSNTDIDQSKLGEFYSHPVWILNGLFIEQHELSMEHRYAISRWVLDNQCTSVLDYGGGFGTLAKLISQNGPDRRVHIFEPHPSEFSIRRLSGIENVSFISAMKEQYDCVIATDVLEHVPNPVEVLLRMIRCVKPGGYLLIANNFYPVMKCHLPGSFHLRYSFTLIAKNMGLKHCGSLKGSHAIIYKKIDNNPSIGSTVILIEKVSKMCFPLLKTVITGLGIGNPGGAGE